MSDKTTEELLELAVKRISEEFKRRLDAYVEEDIARNQAWQESIDAILDSKLAPIRADVADLNNDMKIVKTVVRESSFDTKAMKRDIKDLQKDTQLIKRYIPDIQDHEIRITETEQARAA